MKLREAYCDTELDRLERETKKAIERIMTNPGVQSPEYIPRFNSIMDHYRLTYAALIALKPNPYDNPIIPPLHILQDNGTPST